MELDPGDISGLIILGGEMNVDQIDSHPHLGPLREVVAKAIDSQVPVLGICLGAQILARAAGGEVRPSVREIGFLRVQATAAGLDDPVLAPFAPAADVFQWHEDGCRLPRGAELLFSSDEVPIQAFRLNERAYGVQFHFEVTEREIDLWCDETPDLESKWGVTKHELLQTAREGLAAQKSAAQETAGRFLDLIR